jgi:hypothetical protein
LLGQRHAGRGAKQDGGDGEEADAGGSGIFPTRDEVSHLQNSRISEPAACRTPLLFDLSIAGAKYQSTQSERAWKSFNFVDFPKTKPPEALLEILQIEKYYFLLTVA